MRRFFISVGLGVATAALGAGTAVASPTQYPEDEGWTYTSVTETVPAGYACSGEVRLFIRGHERVIETGPRTTTLEAGADYKATFTNVATGRSMTKRADGDFYDTVVNGGRDLRSVGKGRNFYFGRGVRGILWADGIQKFTVTRYEDPVRATITINKTKGKTVELCNKLGLRAVNGKNLPVEEPAAT